MCKKCREKDSELRRARILIWQLLMSSKKQTIHVPFEVQRMTPGEIRREVDLLHGTYYSAS